MNTIHEPSREILVVHECDICVIGGSCTGVFAAVAAARLGAKVAVVEAFGYFGGTATASLDSVWHTFLDTEFKRQIIGGLTQEIIERMAARGGVIDAGPSEHMQYIFSPTEMILELDRMVVESGIRPFLHARFCAPVMEDGELTAVIIEDKSGRRAIRAKVFVDASGDADLVHRIGLETYKRGLLQPPPTCAVFQGLSHVKEKDPSFSMHSLFFDQGKPEALRPGFLWGSEMPGEDVYMVAGTRVHGADCSDADQLSQAEIEGRRQVRAMMDMLRKYAPGGEKVTLQTLPARIGIRETRHAKCLHTLTEEEVLTGYRFPDAIANGSYRVDVHFADGDGLIFRYLDGREATIYADFRWEHSRWRPESEESPTFYQIPYRSLVPKGATNVLVAGRCLDADEGSFGAVRVMVNTS